MPVADRIAPILTGSIGLYGACWVIYKSIRNQIMFKGIAGAIILRSALTDCIHSLNYIYAAFYIILSDDLAQKNEGTIFAVWIYSTVAIGFEWEMLSSSILAIALAFNSYVIIYLGTAIREQFKLYIVLLSPYTILLSQTL
jgi:hypothetical protein